MPKISQDVLIQEQKENQLRYERHADKLLWKRKLPAEGCDVVNEVFMKFHEKSMIKDYLFRHRGKRITSSRVKTDSVANPNSEVPIIPFTKNRIEWRIGEIEKRESALKRPQLNQFSDQFDVQGRDNIGSLENLLNVELIEQLRECWSKLSPDEQTALKLRHVDGFTYAEAAEAMGLSDSQFRNLYNKAKANLVKCMKPYVDRDESI